MSIAKETLIAIEDTAIAYLLSRWESRHRAEVRALAEMLVCATQSGWGRVLSEIGPIGLQTCTDGAGAFDECVRLYREAHNIADDELAGAVVDFKLMNDLPVDVSTSAETVQ